MQKSELEVSIERLWKAIPIGYGKDFNTVLKELERYQMMYNK